VTTTKQTLADYALHLGRKVKYYRGLKKMTQKELADAAGITLQYLSRVECGRQMPSIKILLAIADILGRDPGQIISFEDPK